MPLHILRRTHVKVVGVALKLQIMSNSLVHHPNNPSMHSSEERLRIELDCHKMSEILNEEMGRLGNT